MFTNNLIAGASGQSTGFYPYAIDQSLRLNDDDSAYLSRTPASAGNLRTWTLSLWVKRCLLGSRQPILESYSGGNDFTAIAFNPSDQLELYTIRSNVDYAYRTDDVFRDTSAWYHFVFVFDSTNATASERWKIYVNGVAASVVVTDGPMPQNTDSYVNSTNQHRLFSRQYFSTLYNDTYAAEINFIDGQALDASSFGETKSGIWIPKDTADLTFGTNGFRLQFGDSAAIGDDTSGNTNDWTANNLVASDVVLDSPSNNWCVWNPLEKTYNTGTPSDGNLTVANSVTCGGTIAIPDDGTKVYFESANVTALNTSGGNFVLGVHEPNNTNWHYNSTSSNAWIIYAASGSAGGGWRFIANGTSGYIASPAPTAAGTVHGCAVWKDGSNWKVYISRGGTWYDSSGTALGSFTEGSPTFTFSYDGLLVPFGAGQANFGQLDFTYTPPDDYVALNSANLPTGAIDTLDDETPEDYFNTVLYTGNGTSQSITGVGFSSSPDLVWIKERSSTSGHVLTDTLRGVNNHLVSSSTGAETTVSGGLTSFDADGFSVGSNGAYNQSSQTYVAWCWDAGGTGVSNTDGSITSTVSVGATSQQNWFSIVSYTGNGTAGATVGHGLDGTVPDMIIVKSRDNARDWRVYHSSLGATKALQLNKTDAANTSSAFWNNTEPTSSVFSIGNVTTVNGSGEDYIAYCFANAEGLCRVGSYTGNGSSTDGTFVFTGFRPKWVLYKVTSTTNSWEIRDAVRDEYNPADDRLYPDSSQAESSNSSVDIDFVSNGFKFRTNAGAVNSSGQSYIYLAIADQDFRFANAR